MTTKRVYRVHELPSGTSAMEDLFNMLGEEGFELVTLSFAEGTAVFEKDIYIEHRSKEHIEEVLKAVKSYGDVHDLEFMLVADNPLSDGPFPPRAVSDDEAWRFLINRILGES
jgi:hypothetical protein